MNLLEYLEKVNITLKEFSESTGISLTSLYLYRLGARRPSLRVAKEIERATHGLVTVKELRDEV